MNTLQRLERWFMANCDGDWEHGSGITISTLDNPGWTIDINVEETTLAGRVSEISKVDRTETDWLHSSCDGTVFKLRCGPGNLEEALQLFLDMAERT
ncbi:MAG: immunity 53 family protein [Planctomycetes bacterium]|jgi:hypothetical protein|nr:immunity 53 family protein [Planctomycetota bacterium]